MLKSLQKYDVVLGSGSPRRKELMSILYKDFRIVKSEKDEIIPPGMEPEQASVHLSQEKSHEIISNLNDNYLLITADTVVILDGQILGKPKDITEAHQMLSDQSGKTHTVVSGVTVATTSRSYSFSDKTLVTLANLTDAEINWYCAHWQVMDKAGAYGIQDWLGVAKVTSLVGSFYNVMGLPTEKLYKVLSQWEILNT